MDKKFLIESLKALLPIIYIFSILYVSGHLSSDYYYHLKNHGVDIYPKFVSFVLSFVGDQRETSLFLLNLFCTAVIPYILIFHITRKLDAGWVYLYSGVPLVMFIIWVIPQSIAHVLMLASIANPLMLIPFLLVGWSIHEYWFLLWLLAAGFHIWKYINKPIDFKVSCYGA
jgi:hypothetical protein